MLRKAQCDPDTDMITDDEIAELRYAWEKYEAVCKDARREDEKNIIPTYNGTNKTSRELFEDKVALFKWYLACLGKIKEEPKIVGDWVLNGDPAVLC